MGNSNVTFFSIKFEQEIFIKLIMKFSESLKKNHQFQFVYKNGRSYANKYFVMIIKENGNLILYLLKIQIILVIVFIRNQ